MPRRLASPAVASRRRASTAELSEDPAASGANPDARSFAARASCAMPRTPLQEAAPQDAEAQSSAVVEVAKFGVSQGSSALRLANNCWHRLVSPPCADTAGVLGRARSNDSELYKLADHVRSGFKRPSWWVLIFGWSLAACAGSVNAVAFRSFGHFVSHATGGTTSIALGLEGVSHGRHGWEEPADAVEMLVSFLAGAFACGLLIDKNHIHVGGKSLYGAALVGNALLLLAAVVQYDLSGHGMLPACFASCACGLQNAMCTSHFGAVIRTTHVTGTLTDIGSTTGRLAMMLLRRRVRCSRLNVLERAEIAVDARKLLVLAPMWASFFLGTIVGAYTWSQMGVHALLLPASLTFFVGLTYTLFRPQMKRRLLMIERARLRKELGEISEAITRSKSFIKDVKMSHAEGGEVVDLEEEFGQMLETMQQVQADLADLYEAKGGQEGNDNQADDDDDCLDIEAGAASGLFTDPKAARV